MNEMMKPIHECEKEVWNGYAKLYLEMMPFSRCYKEIRSKVIEECKEIKKVADIGCGPGLITRLLLENGCEVDAVDNNEIMLQTIREFPFYKKRTNTYLGDLHNLPLKENTYDGVICLNSIYCSKNPEKAVSEIARVLKKNGIIILGGPIKSADTNLVLENVISDFQENKVNEKDIEDFINYNKLITSEQMPTMPKVSELSKIVEDTGFQIKKIDTTFYYNQEYLLVGEKNDY